MKNGIGFVLPAFLFIWGPSKYSGWQATRQALALSDGQFCWQAPHSAGDDPDAATRPVGRDMSVTLNPATPYRFWSALFARDPIVGHTVPHFAVVFPDAKSNQRILGWSLRRAAFWNLEGEISALGLLRAPEFCMELLATQDR